MKKLMFAAVAAAAMVAVAETEQVASQIVGFGPTQLAENGDGICGGASFVNISGEPIDLLDIVVKGQEGAAFGEVDLQTLTPGGDTDAEYQWWDYDDGAGTVMYGWYTFDEEGNMVEVKRGDVVLPVGQGLWSICGGEGITLQTAGEVVTKADIVTTLGEDGDGIPTANPTPVDVDLLDCYVIGQEGGAFGEVDVQALTPGGDTDTEYQWWDYDDGAGTVMYGWYTFDEEGNMIEVKRGDVVLPPGQGLWSICGGEGITFAWPKVEVK